MVRGVFKHLFHFFIVWVFFPHVCLYTVHMYVYSAHREQKRVLDVLELELWTLVSDSQPQVLWKSSQVS